MRLHRVKAREGLTLLWLASTPIGLLAAEEPIPSLRPPRAELSPSFWAQYGWWVALAAILIPGAVVLWIRWLRRPKAIAVIPPAASARAALEALREQPDEGPMAVEISRIFRRYIIAALGLPPDELTTGELQKALQDRPEASPDLVVAIVNFLWACDEWKFSVAPSTPALASVAGALELIEKTEACRTHLPSTAPSRGEISLTS